jgi:hypothetical protein
MQFVGNVHCGDPIISTQFFHSQSLEMHPCLAVDQFGLWKTSVLEGGFQRGPLFSLNVLNWQTIVVSTCDSPA